MRDAVVDGARFAGNGQRPVTLTDPAWKGAGINVLRHEHKIGFEMAIGDGFYTMYFRPMPYRMAFSSVSSSRHLTSARQMERG